MKWISTLTFVFSFVLYLSTVTLAQRGGVPPTHGINHDHVDHDRDVNNDKTHGKADTREERKEPFIDRIQENPQLTQKLLTLLKLPAGTNLKPYANGFKNGGQFMAACNASNNVGVPFDQLKAKMIGPPPMSLGQAIHALKPNLSEKEVDKEADKAEKEARIDEKTKPAAKPVT
jgi:hypothetical protein